MNLQVGPKMAKDSRPLEVLSTQTKQAFEETKQATERMTQSVDETKAQALNAADSYFDFLNRAISSFPTGGTEFGEKLKTFTEKNVVTTHQFVRQLGKAKDFQEVFRVQAEFMQNQMQTLTEQAKSLAEAFTKTATSEVKMPFKSSLA
jgi:hypothetical protein